MTKMMTVEAATAHFAAKGMTLHYSSYDGRKLASTGAVGAATLYADSAFGRTPCGSAEVFETPEGLAMTHYNFRGLDDPAGLLAETVRAAK